MRILGRAGNPTFANGTLRGFFLLFFLEDSVGYGGFTHYPIGRQGVFFGVLEMIFGHIDYVFVFFRIFCGGTLVGYFPMLVRTYFTRIAPFFNVGSNFYDRYSKDRYRVKTFTICNVGRLYDVAYGGSAVPDRFER